MNIEVEAVPYPAIRKKVITLVILSFILTIAVNEKLCAQEEDENSRLDKFHAKVDYIKSKLTKLAEEKKKLESTVSSLKNKQSYLNSEIDGLTQKNTSLTKELEDVKRSSGEKIAALSSEKGELESTVRCLYLSLDSLKSEILLREKLEEAKEKSGVKITPLAEEERKDKETKRVSLEFENTDVKDVLTALAQLYNLKIAAEEKLEGTVSVDLINVDLEAALEAVLKECGYIYSIREDTIVVKRERP